MKLVFDGFESQIQLSPSWVTEYSIAPNKLFCRIVQSLLSEEGQYALEPYQFFTDAGDLIKPKAAATVIESPFSLPWDDKSFFGSFYDHFETQYLQDDQTRREVENKALEIQKLIMQAGYGFLSDYAFGNEWDLKRYLKAFAYKVEYSPSDLLLDNLIKFFALAADVHNKKPLVFVNLEKFLTAEELKTLVEQAIFYGITVLLLENSPSEVSVNGLRKQGLDLHFCEI